MGDEPFAGAAEFAGVVRDELNGGSGQDIMMMTVYVECAHERCLLLSLLRLPGRPISIRKILENLSIHSLTPLRL